VWAADSQCGNGRITVTAHPASTTGDGKPAAGNGSGGSSSWEEWRVLRFNGITRQTVMRVRAAPPLAAAPAAGAAATNGSTQQQGQPQSAGITARPECLAQEYLKTTAAVAAALLGLQRMLPSSDSGRLRALCIGVGGGSLPLFLAHHFPCMGRVGSGWADGWSTEAVWQQPFTLYGCLLLRLGLPPSLPTSACTQLF